jgi:amino acid transporter
LLIGMAALVAIYLIANLGYLAVLGPTGVASSNRLAARAVSTVVAPTAMKLIAIMILISIFSATNGTILSSPRVYYAMARDGLFFHRLAEVHPRFQTPAFAVTAGAVWSAILALTGTFEQLPTFMIFIGWIFYALAAASIFVYRKRMLAAAPVIIRVHYAPKYSILLRFVSANSALCELRADAAFDFPLSLHQKRAGSHNLLAVEPHIEIASHAVDVRFGKPLGAGVLAVGITERNMNAWDFFVL